MSKKARERLLKERVSRFGVNPKPTVKVRMKEEYHDANQWVASSAVHSISPNFLKQKRLLRFIDVAG